MNDHQQTCRDIFLDDPLGRGDSPLPVCCTDFARSRRRCRGQFRYSHRRSQSLRGTQSFARRAAVLELQASRCFADPRASARERDVVLRVIYQMSEAQFKTVLGGQDFRAEAAAPPRIVYSNDMQFELLTALPGAIAFVDSRNMRPGVKVLRVDGSRARRQGLSPA